MAKSVLTIEERTSLRTAWIEGHSISDLAEKYKISNVRVNQILNDNDVTSKRMLQLNIEKKMVVETESIITLKTSLMSVFQKAIAKAEESENPMVYIKDLTPVITAIDKMQRLNQSQPTDIKQTQSLNMNVNVEKRIEELDTPDKMRAFLRKPFENEDNKNNISTAKVIDA